MICLELVYLVYWSYQVYNKMYTSKIHRESHFKNGGYLIYIYPKQV